VLAGVGALLVLAVVAGLVALEQRGTASDRATTADAQRLGSRALAENDLDRSLLLARQGVALDDSAQTRASLLAALNKSPAAIGVLRGAKEGFTGLALSPDGMLAAGDSAGHLFLFDTRTRRRVQAPAVHAGEGRIGMLAFSPDGRRLAIAHQIGEGEVVTVMDMRTRRLGHELRIYDYDRRVTGLSLEADAVVVASRPERSTTTVPTSVGERLDTRTGRRILGPVTLARGQSSPLLGMSDGRQLLTATDGELVVRDAGTLKPVARVGAGALHGSVIALSSDDRTVALGGQDGSVRFLDLRSGRLRPASGRHSGAVTAARFTPDGRSLVTASDDGEAILWNVRAGAASETLQGHANGITALQISGDGRTLYTSGVDGAIFIWDLAGTRRLGRPIDAGGPNGALAALSTDGRRLALGHANGTITVVDLSRPDERRTFPVVPDGNAVTGVRFVPGSRLAIVLGANELVALVDTDSGRVVRTIASRPGDEADDDHAPASLSADGSLLAVPRAWAASGNVIQVGLWRLPSGRPVGKPLVVGRTIHDLQLSPDGRRLLVVLDAAGLEGGVVETWDVRTRRRLRALKFAQAQSLARFSPDGRLFAVGNRYGETRVYDTATFKPVTRVLSADPGAIIGAAITRDDRTLATGSETGAVQLWDIRTGHVLGAPLPGVPSSGVIPAFTPDGGHLVAAYATGRAYLWDIRPASVARHACDVAGRRLTRAEWEAFLPGREYAPAC